MFQDDSLLFSPWFRLIVHKWMIAGPTSSSNDEKKDGWWSDLKRTMTTNDFCDYEMIHRFDPPREHMGGGGGAGVLFDGVGGEKVNGNVANGDAS